MVKIASKFADNLKVCFFLNNKIISKREGSDFKILIGESKLSDDNSLYLDLNSFKDKTILNLIMKSETIQLDCYEYRILEKSFIIDGTALFIYLDKVE